MSLLLAVTQRPISKICIPTEVAYTMLPCRKSGPTKTTKALAVLLMEDLSEKPGRRLAGSGASSSDHCESQVHIYPYNNPMLLLLLLFLVF